MDYRVKENHLGDVILHNSDGVSVARFSSKQHYLHWQVGAREHSMRTGEAFSVYDDDTEQFIAGTLDQITA